MKSFPIYLLFLMFSFNLQASDKIILGSPIGSIADVSTQILSYAYEQIGVAVEIVILPDERSLLWSNSGYHDGEVMRIAAVDKMYPNLVRIPVALDKFEAMAFSKRKDIAIQNWGSLRSYTISYRLGTKFAERGTKGMNVRAFASNKEVFEAINKGGYDIAVASRLTGIDTISSFGLTNISAIEPPLASFQLYHFLNKKHQSLIPRITKKLQEMKDNGMINRIREEYFAHKVLR